MVKMTFRTDERDQVRKLIEQYGCSPFTGKCHVDEIPIQKVGKTYHIILTEDQINKFEIKDDFILEVDKKHQYLIMIKPTAQDNNYLFFRRV
jgi:hypothetical protein